MEDFKLFCNYKTKSIKKLIINCFDFSILIIALAFFSRNCAEYLFIDIHPCIIVVLVSQSFLFLFPLLLNLKNPTFPEHLFVRPLSTFQSKNTVLKF
jgi:hypothetical protein